MQKQTAAATDSHSCDAVDIEMNWTVPNLKAVDATKQLLHNQNIAPTTQPRCCIPRPGIAAWE